MQLAANVADNELTVVVPSARSGTLPERDKEVPLSVPVRMPPVVPLAPAAAAPELAVVNHAVSTVTAVPLCVINTSNTSSGSEGG